MTAQTTALHYLSLDPKDTAFWKLTAQSSPLQKAALVIVSIVAVPLEMIARCFYNAALWIYSNLCHRSILPAEVLHSRFSIPVTETIAGAEQTILAEHISEKDPLIPQPILPAEVFQPRFSAPVTTTIAATEEIIPAERISEKDQLIAHPFSKELEKIDFHFDADYFTGTDKETLASVSATELFYQQKQIAKFCSIHCLCNFAGRNIDQLVPKLIQTNNEYLCDNFQKDWQMTPDRALESAKRTGLYMRPLYKLSLIEAAYIRNPSGNIWNTIKAA